MSLGIYKPGQGYWVRVLTAAMIGVATLYGAAWLWEQMALVADRLPKTRMTVPIEKATAVPVAGQSLTLVEKQSAPDEPPKQLGSVRVLSYDESARLLRLGEFEPARADADPTQAAVLTGDAGLRLTVLGRPSRQSAVNPIYVSGGAVAVLIVVGAVLAYYFAGMKKSSTDFLIATDTEMKKVNWSTPKDIRGSTIVVIAASVLVALFLFTIDLGFQTVFRTIGLLGTR